MKINLFLNIKVILALVFIGYQPRREEFVAKWRFIRTKLDARGKKLQACNKNERKCLSETNAESGLILGRTKIGIQSHNPYPQNPKEVILLQSNAFYSDEISSPPCVPTALHHLEHQQAAPLMFLLLSIFFSILSTCISLSTSS